MPQRKTLHNHTLITTLEVEGNDVQNYGRSRHVLGDHTQIPDSISQLYDIVHHLIGPKLKTEQDRVALTLSTPQNIKHLLVGANSLYRCYASQMFREVRAAVEATGMAWLIRTDKDKYKIFTDDKGLDKSSRKAARKAFTAKFILPHSQHLLKILSEHYDEASEKAHTNFRGFMGQLSLKPGESESHFSINDLKDPLENLPGHLAWMCRVHLDIIETVTRLIFVAEFVPSADFQELLSETTKALSLM